MWAHMEDEDVNENRNENRNNNENKSAGSVEKKCVYDSGFCGVIAAGMKTTMIKKPGEKVMAVWDGSRARYGNCHGVLGDFSKADGEIKCRKNDCKAVNVVRKP